jgi:hypothetical protein
LQGGQAHVQVTVGFWLNSYMLCMMYYVD